MKKFKTWIFLVIAFGVLIHLGWLLLASMNDGVPTFEYGGALTGWIWLSLISWFVAPLAD